MEAIMALAAVSNISPSRRRSRDVLQTVETLRRQNPRAGEDQLVELLADELYDDRGILLDAARFIICKAPASAKTKRPKATPRQCVTRVREAEKETVRAIAGKVRDLVALDMTVTLLDGTQKALRFCLGSELEQLGTAYQRIAERVGADVMVGEALTSAEAQALMQE
jgi:hypothetical protein